MEHEFNPATFVEDVKKIIANGEEALHEAMRAFNWALRHLKEIRKHVPDYRQEWLRETLDLVFSIDAQVYCRVARHLGGKSRGTDASFRTGAEVIRTFGWERCWRADALLTQEQMNTIGERAKMGEFANREAFSDAVKVMADVLATKEARPGPERIDYRKEYERLRNENTELKTKLAAAEAELTTLREWKAAAMAMV